jgi:hypothetical protein
LNIEVAFSINVEALAERAEHPTPSPRFARVFNVRVLENGCPEWKAAGLPIEVSA